MKSILLQDTLFSPTEFTSHGQSALTEPPSLLMLDLLLSSGMLFLMLLSGKFSSSLDSLNGSPRLEEPITCAEESLVTSPTSPTPSLSPTLFPLTFSILSDSQRKRLRHRRLRDLLRSLITEDWLRSVSSDSLLSRRLREQFLFLRELYHTTLESQWLLSKRCSWKFRKNRQTRPWASHSTLDSDPQWWSSLAMDN